MTFEEYLQEHHSQWILEKLMSLNTDDGTVTLPGIPVEELPCDPDPGFYSSARSLQIRKIWYRMGEVSIHGTNNEENKFDLGFTILFDVEFYTLAVNEYFKVPGGEIRQYYAECAADVDGFLRTLTISRFLEKNGKSDLEMRVLRKAGFLSDYPVRTLREEELEERAEHFLEKYCPAALKEPMRLPIANIITDQMGLDLFFDKPDPDERVMGRIFFAECDADVCTQGGERVKKHFHEGTITVDLGIDPQRDRGPFRFTMTHEACHWEWDRTLMKLLNLLDGRIYLSETVKTEGADPDNTGVGKDAIASYQAGEKHGMERKCPFPPEMFRIMEQNADRIAARILIPKATVSDAIHTLFERDISGVNGFVVRGRYLEDMVSALAEFYGVSKMAMKIRTEELGFIEFTGVLNYVDGQYVPAFCAGKEKQGDCGNYLIEEDQLIRALSDKPSLLRLYVQGKVIFAEGKLTLNDPRYVTEESGKPCLTPYAREHVDECCFRFDLKYRKRRKVREGRITGMEKDGNKSAAVTDFLLAPTAESHDGNSSCRVFLDRIDAGCFVEAEIRYDEKAQSLEEEARNLDAIECQFRILLDTRDLVPEKLSDAIVYHMKRLHITIDMLSERTGIDPRTIIRYRKGTTVPSLEDLIAVCVGLHLAPQFSLELLKKARYQFSDSKEDLGYELILKKYAQYRIEDCNKILSRCGGGHIGRL